MKQLKQSKIESIIVFSILTLMVLFTTIAVNAMVMLNGTTLLSNVLK